MRLLTASSLTSVAALALIAAALLSIALVCVPAAAQGGRKASYALKVEVIPLNAFANGSYIGTEVFRGLAAIYVKPLNRTFVKVRVVFEGVLERLTGERIVCKAATVESNCRLLVGKSAKAKLTRLNVSLDYLVDRRFNYAWLLLGGGRREFVGFLPYYIVPDLSYTNVSKLDVVYLGEPLKLLIDNGTGKPLPVHINMSGRILYTVRLSNKYLALYLVHHYPVEVYGVTPIPGKLFHTNSSIAKIYGTLPKKLVGVIASIDDYPSGVVTIDWGKLAILAAVVGAGVGLAVYAILRRRRR